ncbi:MAG: GNAT family N-acetyltransferase [Bacilli bacterium]
MLLKYKKTYEKIAMGLLSLATHERDVKRLRELVLQYEQSTPYELYLWKVEEDFVAIVGVYHVDDATLQVHHVSVNPSMRRGGIGKQMVCALRERFPSKTISATEQTQEFVTYCLCTNDETEVR